MRQRKRILAAGLLLLANTPALAARLEVILRLAGAPVGAPPVAATLTLTPITAGESEVPSVFDADTGSRTELELAAGTWRLEAAAPGHWSQAEQVLLSEEGAEVVLRVHPAGTIQGRIKAPATDTQSVRLGLAPGFGASARGTLPVRRLTCPVSEGRWSCTVPALTYDLAFEIEGMAPIRRWGIAIEAGAEHDLGLLRFRPGTSIWGRVETESGAPLAPTCRVELLAAGVPKVASGGDPAFSPPGSPRSRSTSLSATGHYQFIGVPAGRYLVAASDEELVSVPIAPMSIRGEPRELQLPPLLLRTPGSLKMVFDPPVDPFDRQWVFRLSSLDPGSREPNETLHGAASADGVFTRERLPPGPYRLTLLGAFDPEWAAVEFELGSEELFLTISPGLVGLRGRAWLGNEPLAATLVFRRLSPEVEVSFATDDFGLFSGFLPRQGPWQVTAIRAEGEEQQEIEVGSVDVRVRSGDRLAEVEVLLPGTELAGWVVDGAGNPVPGATVRVIWLEGSDEITGGTPGKVGGAKQRRTRTGPDGAFRLVGLPTGAIAVRAERGRRATGTWAHTVIEEGRELPKMLLRVSVLP